VISKTISLILASAIACAGGITFAQQAPDAQKASDTQQAPDATKTPAAASSTAPGGSDSADAEAAAAAAAIAKANAAAAAAAAKAPPKITDEATLAKLAKKAGWHTEVQNGTLYYCRVTADVGTRFSSKKCATPTQLAVVLEQQEFARDLLKQRGCGGNCGGN
jgi:hypothetical protein